VSPKWALLLVLLAIARPAAGEETVIMSVHLNTVLKGETLGLLTAEGDILLPVQYVADELGIRAEGSERAVEGTRYVSLRSLFPRVRYRFDDKELALHIEAAPETLGVSTFDLGRKPPEGTVYPRQSSAFLNYSLNYDAGEDFEFEGFNVPFEAGVRWGDYLLFSNFFYRRNDVEGEFVRLFSSIVRDYPEAMTRVTVGDFTAATGDLGGGANLGGVSIAKNFGLNPYFIQYPGLDLSGLVSTPSDVEVWRNGTLLRRERVQPGQFEFQNLIPATTGSGEITLLIRDAFGEEKTIQVPFYYTTSILKKGLHEYSYVIGFTREEFGQDSFTYTEPAFLGVHRYGFSDYFTGGARLELSKGLASFGLTSGLVVKGLGLFDVALGYSLNDHDGHAYSVGYSYASRKIGLSWRIALRGFSEHYSNLSLDPDQDRPRTEVLASLGYGNRALGALSFLYSSSDNFVREDIQRFTVRYSKVLTRRLSFDVTASHIEEENTEEELLVTLRYLFGWRTSAFLSYQLAEDEQTGSVTVQHTPAGRRGLGYRAIAERRENDLTGDTDTLDGELTYYGQYGVYSGRYRNVDGSDAYNLRTSGSIALVGGSVHFGQPVWDSFAVVKVGDLEGVEVYHNNIAVGQTDGEGEALVPFLNSYYGNKISVQTTDLPFNYEAKTVEKYVSPPFRSGSYVQLEVEKLQAIVGRAFVKDDEGERPAKYWLLTITVDGRDIDAPVVDDGEFYLENIPVGTHPAVLRKGQQRCAFQFTVPRSEEMMLDLGKITCVMER
jgi:outer membrane usher protein